LAACAGGCREVAENDREEERRREKKREDNKGRDRVKRE
jgi:hypothetical protein